MAAPGHTDLVVDVVSRLTEEMDGALLGEPPTRRRIAAETSMLRHQRVRAVAQSACGHTKRRERVLKADVFPLIEALVAFISHCKCWLLLPSTERFQLRPHCEIRDFFSFCAVK